MIHTGHPLLDIALGALYGYGIGCIIVWLVRLSVWMADQQVRVPFFTAAFTRIRDALEGTWQIMYRGIDWTLRRAHLTP